MDGRYQGRGFCVEPLPPLAPALSASAPSANAPFPHGLTAILQPSAAPHQQRLGYFSRFSPLPSGSAALIRPSAASPLPKVGVSMAISSPTFRKRCPYKALCGTPPAKVGVFLALFTPTFGKRQAPSPLSFRLQKFTLRPSSRPAVHHSAVFCTERSRECLAYRKRPFFCTACIRKRLAYNRRPLFCTGRRIASRL